MYATNSTIYYEFSSSVTIDDINITSNSSILSNKTDSADSVHRLIKYDFMINRTNNYHNPEISFNDIDKYDFNNHAFI